MVSPETTGDSYRAQVRPKNQTDRKQKHMEGGAEPLLVSKTLWTARAVSPNLPHRRDHGVLITQADTALLVWLWDSACVAECLQ